MFLMPIVCYYMFHVPCSKYAPFHLIQCPTPTPDLSFHSTCSTINERRDKEHVVDTTEHENTGFSFPEGDKKKILLLEPPNHFNFSN
jgi:hypothetical protein